MFDSFFIFEGKFYEQWMEQQRVFLQENTTLANNFVCHFENIWLENCPPNFKPITYRRFVGDTFDSFEQRIMLKSLKIISKNNIKT